MDMNVDAEWNALFSPPSDDISFEFTGLHDSDGFDSPIYPSGQSTPGDSQHALELGDNLQNILNDAISGESTPDSQPMPKSGGRFSREVVRVLRDWLNAHKARPYPINEEMEMLQRRTGLNKTQIANWFANARRRGKLSRAPSSYSSQNTSSRPVDIAPRPDTPAFKRKVPSLNPMERWQSSPPEHEPAAVSDIARAVESNVGTFSDNNNRFEYKDDTNQSWYNTSSASSAGTSASSDLSATSQHSKSINSVKSAAYSRKRRMRARIPRTSLVGFLLPYQCTFCTEDFKTKHDWQRHEKSLHLPTEQWICTLHGPQALKLDTGHMCCVFCNEPEPNDAHLGTHNYHSCRERKLEGRTFNRKDHLNQHLQLVHNSKFDKLTMSSWRVPMSSIKTRCGFCDLKMETWEERVDHLAGHFKQGVTMASWQGDWGLDDRHQKLLENAIPPYLIDYERSTPAPFSASQRPDGSPTTAYELIKIELDHSMQTRFDLSGRMPDNSSMQLEACRIVFASEALSTKQDTCPSSWLRDLIMSSQHIANEAKFGPLRLHNECRLSTLEINGRDNIFELCPLEARLWTFVQAERATVGAVTDETLQNEASKIVTYMEQISNTPSDVFANWLIKLIHADTDWLSEFKMRACSSESGPALDLEPQDAGSILTHHLGPVLQPFPLYMESIIDSSQLDIQEGHVDPVKYYLARVLDPPRDSAQAISPARSRMFINSANFFSWLVRDLARWVAATMSPNNPNCHIPTDEEIQHQARCIVYDDDDPWNQTAADNAQWLRQFKRDVGILDELNDPNEANLSSLYI
ncbi:hypothetical protein C7974DRAFT_129279 [Boeremia exigua]|uniref:uncharacterized protein n=1 Tax=Boeremia exigua TaxID=749465 RepID=UPI001E8CA58F|nr:uncharacterized protein C7974DRAFT_129279 [Boeremia exigua]KAH6639333.1 hypothetical protein C7974DRAFT_129279 [Boeremia exigua]